MHETYHSDLDGKDFAYDGEKSLFTAGSLPRNKLEFIVVLEDITSNRWIHTLFIYIFWALQLLMFFIESYITETFFCV